MKITIVKKSETKKTSPNICPWIVDEPGQAAK